MWVQFCCTHDCEGNLNFAAIHDCEGDSFAHDSSGGGGGTTAEQWSTG